MSLRPVDLQVLIPRATEVGRTQHVADQQHTLKQQQFAEQWQQISAGRQQQVQSTTKIDGGKVRKEKDKENQSSTKHDSQFGDESSAHKDQELKKCDHRGVHHGVDPVRGNLIDIKT